MMVIFWYLASARPAWSSIISSVESAACRAKYILIRKDRQPNTENPLKLNLSGVIVKHLPYRGK